MNQQKGDDLREKHKPTTWTTNKHWCEYCWQWDDRLYQAERVEWPCDVIQVLDAWEQEELFLFPSEIDPDLKPFSPEELEDIHRYERRMEEEEFIHGGEKV